ncbi:MAG: amidase family protein, partial [Chitinophagales bacterium]
MFYSSLETIQLDLKSGAVSCTELVQHYLTNIHLHKNLNAFIEVFEEEAIEQATVIDQKLKDGTAGKLAGMVISIKDVLCYKNHKVSAASKMLESFTALYTATAVERLLQEDAIIIGRTNCDEFAMGSSNENSAFGNVLNGFDSSRVPGGSSGGAAVSVQMNMCLAALGSDTGGSVRQPASFCGLVGMKPTYGRISRYGLVAYASSFDQIGTLTHNLYDAALLLEIMAGPDEYDSTVASKTVEAYSKKLQPKEKYSIAFLPEVSTHEKVDASIRKWMDHFFIQLKSNGHDVAPVSFPHLDYLVPAYYVLTTAEASANLARYD